MFVYIVKTELYYPLFLKMVYAKYHQRKNQIRKRGCENEICRTNFKKLYPEQRTCKERCYTNLIKCKNCKNVFCKDCDYATYCTTCLKSYCIDCINSDNFEFCTDCGNCNDCQARCNDCGGCCCNEYLKICEYCNWVNCKL